MFLQAESALQPPRRSPATVVVRLVTSLANALSQVPVTTTMLVVLAVLAVLAVRSATSAARSDILLATAPRAEVTAVDMVVATVVAMVDASRLATLAVVTATWLAIAPRVRSATTVSEQLSIGVFFSLFEQMTYDCFLGGEVGHVSRDCPTEANGERVCYKCKQPGHVQAACPV